jgi:hypothetical protein
VITPATAVTTKLSVKNAVKKPAAKHATMNNATGKNAPTILLLAMLLLLLYSTPKPA